MKFVAETQINHTLIQTIVLGGRHAQGIKHAQVSAIVREYTLNSQHNRKVNYLVL